MATLACCAALRAAPPAFFSSSASICRHFFWALRSAFDNASLPPPVGADPDPDPDPAVGSDPVPEPAPAGAADADADPDPDADGAEEPDDFFRLRREDFFAALGGKPTGKPG